MRLLSEQQNGLAGAREGVLMGSHGGSSPPATGVPLSTRFHPAIAKASASGKVWFERLGFLQKWCRHEKARLRFLWLQGLTNSDVGKVLFDEGLKPASFLYHGANLPKDNPDFMLPWEKAEQVLSQIESMRLNAFSHSVLA